MSVVATRTPNGRRTPKFPVIKVADKPRGSFSLTEYRDLVRLARKRVGERVPDELSKKYRSSNDILEKYGKVNADLHWLIRFMVNGFMRPSDIKFIKHKHVTVEGNSPRLTPVGEKNLWKSVYLSYLMFSNPEAELWRIGAEAMLVDRLVGTIDPTGRRMNASEDYARRHLTLTVVRHHEWAFNTAEHAAVDDFPCKSKLSSVQGRFDFTDQCRCEQLFATGAEEMGNARAEVLRCSGARAKLSVKPTLHHQGLLF